MINLEVEPPITLSEAAGLQQLRRNGMKPHIAQLYRWAKNGIKGHKLETIVVAGSRCTTREAVNRWIAALSGMEAPQSQRTPIRRIRDHEKADQQLAEAGW